MCNWYPPLKCNDTKCETDNQKAGLRIERHKVYGELEKCLYLVPVRKWSMDFLVKPAGTIVNWTSGISQGYRGGRRTVTSNPPSSRTTKQAEVEKVKLTSAWPKSLNSMTFLQFLMQHLELIANTDQWSVLEILSNTDQSDNRWSSLKCLETWP